jgi:hypothetical protein
MTGFLEVVLVHLGIRRLAGPEEWTYNIGRRSIVVANSQHGEKPMAKKRKRVVKSPGHTFEVKAEIANTTLAKARSALTLQIYRKELKLGELQIGRGSLFWSGARRQSAKRIHWGRFAEMMDRLAYGDT